MLCQDCKKREATVHLTQIVNNEKQTLSLCKDCAAARGFHSPLDNVPFPLADILSGLAESVSPARMSKSTENLICDSCGTSFDEFARKGRFGCGECYVKFRPLLESIMRKIHGASLHRGRNPESSTASKETALPIKEEERLGEELKKAIESEDFERAAELRDKLQAVRESVAADQ
jgi:protein arginine kinase activator